MELVEVDSASSSGRPLFNKMVDFLKRSPDCRVVIAEKVDRLLRNLEDEVTLEKLDIEKHFVKDGRIISKQSRSSDKLAHRFQLVVATSNKDNLKEESAKGILKKASMGIYPGPTPIGYLNVDLKIGKRGIAPDPERAPLMTMCFERYATGNYSLKDLIEWAVAAGLTYRARGNPIRKSTLQNCLRNRIYTGDFVFNGVLYSGTHTPLVSVELWERVQEILSGRYARRHRVVKHDLAFSGLIRCWFCGCAVVGEIKKNRYTYYHCTGQRGKCSKHYVREEILEGQFSEAIASMALPVQFVEWACQALRESREEAMARLNSELSRVQNRLDTMYWDKMENRISADMYDRLSQRWSDELVNLRRNLDQQRSDAPGVGLVVGAQLLELAKNAQNLFDKQPAREKRKLLNFVVSNSTLKDDELTVTYRQPFDLFATWSETMKKPPMSEGLENSQREKWLLR